MPVERHYHSTLNPQLALSSGPAIWLTMCLLSLFLFKVLPGHILGERGSAQGGPGGVEVCVKVAQKGRNEAFILNHGSPSAAALLRDSLRNQIGPIGTKARVDQMAQGRCHSP